MSKGDKWVVGEGKLGPLCAACQRINAICALANRRRQIMASEARRLRKVPHKFTSLMK